MLSLRLSTTTNGHQQSCARVSPAGEAPGGRQDRRSQSASHCIAPAPSSADQASSLSFAFTFSSFWRQPKGQPHLAQRPWKTGNGQTYAEFHITHVDLRLLLLRRLPLLKPDTLDATDFGADVARMYKVCEFNVYCLSSFHCQKFTTPFPIRKKTLPFLRGR